MDNKARELADWFVMTNGDIENLVDKGLRHKSGVKPLDYLNHWLYIARHFGFATHDDSWGEFEKEFAIIIRRLVRAEQKLETHAQEAAKWEKNIKGLKDVHAIQSADGNWNYDDYMWGMFNGLELALAMFENRKPSYRTLARAEKMGVV